MTKIFSEIELDFCMGKIGFDYGCSSYMKELMLASILIREFQASVTGIYQSKNIAVSRQGIFIQDYFSKNQKLPLNLNFFYRRSKKRDLPKVWVSS